MWYSICSVLSICIALIDVTRLDEYPYEFLYNIPILYLQMPTFSDKFECLILFSVNKTLEGADKPPNDSDIHYPYQREHTPLVLIDFARSTHTMVRALKSNIFLSSEHLSELSSELIPAVCR